MSVKKPENRLTGVAASPGIAFGTIVRIGGDAVKVAEQPLQPDQVSKEVKKLKSALSKSKDDLQEMYKKTLDSYGAEAAEIFSVHKMMLEDPTLVQESENKITKDLLNADYAFSTVMEKYIGILRGMKDDLFKARSADVIDLKRRVIRYIQGSAPSRLKQLKDPAIIFAKELTPSETIRIERGKVLGFAMDFGARTSHATILARSIKVPAVVGLNNAGDILKDDDFVILDGDEGMCIVNPTRKTIEAYRKRHVDYVSFEKKLLAIKGFPARTKDGKDIEIASNIEFPQEVDAIVDLRGDGIGLYRTEYLFLTGDREPEEEHQFQEYKSIVEKLNGKPLIIRTFDLGGDKPLEYLPLPVETNPFLGVRGVRLYRDSGHEFFRTQLRAIIRASAFGDIRIMFPMIACVSEIRYCRKIISDIMTELGKSKVKFNKNIPIGAMVEIPSAAATADLLAKECDFLSIGTNDLIQYTIAVDRGNKNLAYLYQPYNPAVLRFIRDTIEKGHQQGAWVGMCGEVASDPLLTMVLIGLGLDEFSVSPVSHLLIKAIVRHVEFSECENLAEKALALATSEDVGGYLKDIYNKKFKHLQHFPH
jgi:phosphoenolpyruvate-protein phosphotransferase (PTS system enzyme I)